MAEKKEKNLQSSQIWNMGCAIIEETGGGVWFAPLTGTRGFEASPNASL